MKPNKPQPPKAKITYRRAHLKVENAAPLKARKEPPFTIRLVSTKTFSEAFRVDRPPQYQHDVTPWCAQQSMQSTGDVFTDARLADVIKYVMRTKGAKLADLKKAQHCLAAAIERLESLPPDQIAPIHRARSDGHAGILH